MEDTSKKRPNLFVIGAMKSGTTSLHHYLNLHPDIFMSDPKELWYFVQEKNWPRGEAWYLDHFRQAKDAAYRGESSADYTMFPIYRGVPERLHGFAPAARLIYIMREPVQRAISHYWYDVQASGEKRRMTEAVGREEKYVYYSDYALQLERYYRFFPRQQIYPLSFESLVTDPAGAMSAIFTWLGLDPAACDPSGLGRPHNATPDRVEQVRGMGALHRFRYSRFWDRLHPLAPRILLQAGRRLGYRTLDRRAATPPEIVAYLTDRLAESRLALFRLLERDFPEWDEVA